MYVCMYVCMCARMYVRMYVYVYICECIRIYIYIYVFARWILMYFDLLFDSCVILQIQSRLHAYVLKNSCPVLLLSLDKLGNGIQKLL